MNNEKPPVKGLLFKPQVLSEHFDTGDGQLSDAFSIVEIQDFHCIQAHVGCDMFTTIPGPNADQHRGFLDDNGLNNGTEYFTRFNYYSQPVAGNILFLNADHDGESIDCEVTPSDILEHLIYVGKRDMVMYLETTYVQEELAND